MINHSKKHPNKPFWTFTKPTGTPLTFSIFEPFLRNFFSPYRPQQTPPPQRRPGGAGNATNVRITKAILDSILLNPEHFTQISHDKPPHLCTFLKVKSRKLQNFNPFQLASPDDARQFKGGKNYQTTIQGRVKQIFSYIPHDQAMYQYMVQNQLVLRPPPSQPQQQQQPPPQQQHRTQRNGFLEHVLFLEFDFENWKKV